MIHPIHESPFTQAIYNAVCDEISRLRNLNAVDWTGDTERVCLVLETWRSLLESGKHIEMEISSFPTMPIRL